MELENEVDLEQNIERNIEIEEATLDNQKSFFQTTIGKVVNTRIRCWIKNDITRFSRRSNYTSKRCNNESGI